MPYQRSTGTPSEQPSFTDRRVVAEGAGAIARPPNMRGLPIYSCPSTSMDDPRITAIDQHHDKRAPAASLSDLVGTGPAYRSDHHALPDMPALRDLKPYRCGTCDKSFQKPTELSRHERSHSGARPFQCKTCQKCFLKASDLKRHDRIHTGERPYICPVCGRSFAEGGSLQRHSRMHTGERPYACSICHKQFVRSYNAKKHTKMHGTVVASVIITKNLVPATLPKQQSRETAQATPCDAIGVPTMPSLISPIREPTEMGSPSINTLVLEATNQSQTCNSSSVTSMTIPRPPTSVLDSFMHP